MPPPASQAPEECGSDECIVPSGAYLSNNVQRVSAGTSATPSIVYRVPSGSGPLVRRFLSPEHIAGTNPTVMVVR